MWTVVYIAPNANIAEKLREQLLREGVLVTLRSVGNSQCGQCRSFEVLVPEGEIEEANEIINEAIGQR